ncbi:MAG TPA: pectate lyase, partial [Verrucomicrobiota bacterium]|nr:pectate lyase [Verrucomicrobiota bacterium]
MSGLRHSASILAVALFVLIAIPAGAQTPAFPGAEGFGRFATGGRGGDVYHVTTLEDSGPGSFRDAVSKPNRIVVFDVGGVIRIRSRISVAPNITIAGQTAPGPGITVYGNGLSFSGANNSITRHIRFRMGVGGDSGKDAITIAHGHDMIFDHVSVAWGRDENFSISGPVTNVTIQNCIIAQGLQPHSCGGLIQTDGGVSILRTLYIDNHTRNPKVKGVNQFVNNVVYNWGGG